MSLSRGTVVVADLPVGVLAVNSFSPYLLSAANACSVALRNPVPLGMYDGWLVRK
jgi:hypothetical protein